MERILHLFYGRVLESKPSESYYRTNPINLKNLYFDHSLKKTKLPFQFDFDNNRGYFYRRIPMNLLDYFNYRGENSGIEYDVMNSINTKNIESYDIITKCKAPDSLTENSEADIPKLSLNKLDQLIFQKHTKKNLMKKVEKMRDLTMYKFCLIKEFINDDQVKNPSVLLELSYLDVYHKLYRKSLQPIFDLSIKLESEYLIEHLIRGNAQHRLMTSFKLELFCIYLKHHMKLKFHKYFMKGNDFSCSISNYHLIFEFSGITKELYSFVEVILEHFHVLKEDRIYDQEIIENVKERIINKYSEFDSITSLKYSMYLLKKISDCLFVDYSNQDKF